MSKRRKLFFEGASEAYCDGFGMLVCHCGGDLCVCGDDGQDCFGCEKCADRDDPYFDDDDEFELRVSPTAP